MNTAQDNLDSLLLLNFGYVSAADLILWCDQQLIISALNRSPSSVQKAVNAAIALVSDKLRNVYDLSQELARQDTVAPSATATIDAQSGEVTEASILGAGTNFTAVPTVVVTNAAGDPGTGAEITAEVSDSVITKIELLKGGAHYRQPPVISFIGSGTGASATCTLDKFGHIISIELVSGGTGWAEFPQIVFTPVDSFGFGAAAAAQVQFGKLTGLVVAAPGSGYAAAPSLSFEGGQLADARYPSLVMIISINAIRMLMGNAEGVSDVMIANFKMADALIDDMRAGLDSLPLYGATRLVKSTTELVQDKFRQLG